MKPTTQKPHDAFFKATFGDLATAKDFLHHYLPHQLHQLMNLETIELQDTSFITPELRENHSDLIFKLQMGGQEGHLYFLFEHKSYLASGVVFQLLRYMVEFWEDQRLNKKVDSLPIILPFVFYHGTAKWGVPLTLAEKLIGFKQLQPFVGRYVPTFEYILYDLSKLSDERLKGLAKTKMALTIFRDVFRKDSTEFLNSLHTALLYVADQDMSESFRRYLQTTLIYILNTAQKEYFQEIIMMLQEIPWKSINGEELIMTIAEELRQEGREEGREEALSSTVTMQLTQKFKELPQHTYNLLQNADYVTLENIAKDIFIIETVEEVERYFIPHQQ